MPWLKRRLGTLVHAVARPLVRGFVPRKPGTRRVLFACHNSLTASYLAEIWDLVRDDPRIECSLCLRRPEHHPGDWQACRKALPVDEVPQRFANVLPWDLVVMADHAGAFHALATPSRHAVLRISHGIGGKRSGGADYYYGPLCFDATGLPVYTCLFESSIERRDEIRAANPELGSRVSVIGCLRADRIRRAKVSKRHHTATGCNGRPKVLIAGSWGPGNLFSRLGDQLPAELARLEERYAFILRPHPHLIASTNRDSTNWPAYFDRARRLGLGFSDPAESAEFALADADWLITDDLSSMGLLAALGGLRVAVVPSGAENVGTNTFLAALRDASPTFGSVQDLEPILGRLRDERASPAVIDLCHQMNSQPDQSFALARSEIDRLLGLSSPASPMNA